MRSKTPVIRTIPDGRRPDPQNCQNCSNGIGTLSLSAVRAAFARGCTPEEVAREAGITRQTLVSQLARRGLRPVQRWELAVITPAPADLALLTAEIGDKP
jgi:hypothetical protein